MRERDARAVSRETKTSHVTSLRRFPLAWSAVHASVARGTPTRRRHRAAGTARLRADWRAAPFHTVSGERFSPSPIGYRYGDGVGEAGEKVEGNTRVHGRNSMNWYRLAAHFVPRSRSCGWLVKRSDPFLPSPPLSLLVVDSHHSRAFFSLLSFSPAGGREPSHEGSGSRRGFFSLLSLSSLLSNDETNGESRSSERCFTFVSYVYGGSYFGRCSLTGTWVSLTTRFSKQQGNLGIRSRLSLKL